jgi:hypothetical protein
LHGRGVRGSALGRTPGTHAIWGATRVSLPTVCGVMPEREGMRIPSGSIAGGLRVRDAVQCHSTEVEASRGWA